MYGEWSGEQDRRRSAADELRIRTDHDRIGVFADSGSVLGQDFRYVLCVGHEVDEGEGACKRTARIQRAYVISYNTISLSRTVADLREKSPLTFQFNEPI